MFNVVHSPFLCSNTHDFLYSKGPVFPSTTTYSDLYLAEEEMTEELPFFPPLWFGPLQAFKHVLMLLVYV